jgi:molybdate/tungstate transport system permease protein
VVFIKSSKFFFVFLFLGMVLLLFLTLPLVKMIFGVDKTALFEAAQDGVVLASIFLTLKVAFYATVFVSLTGIPLAYLLARYDFFGKSIIETIIDIPTLIPHTAVGIALLGIFGSGYFVGSIFENIGISFMGTEAGIMIAMMYLSAPYLINGAKEGFKKVDPKLEKVARTLGAGAFSVFTRVSLPLAKRDIFNGAIMMWARGIGEFGAVVILAYHPMTASVLIYDKFNSFGLSYSAPVAALMVIICITIFVTMRRLNNIDSNKL